MGECGIMDRADRPTSSSCANRAGAADAANLSLTRCFACATRPNVARGAPSVAGLIRLSEERWADLRVINRAVNLAIGTHTTKAA